LLAPQPAVHVHGPDCKHHDEHTGTAGRREERELLPWLKLAATLDPNRSET